MSDFYKQHAGPELQAAARLSEQGAEISAPVTSADDEAFVTALTTSLVLLVHAWRERAGFVGAHTRTAETYGLCASELEAVLRSAT